MRVNDTGTGTTGGEIGRQRIAVVTGASGGIGQAIAVRLAAEHGMKVIVLARSPSRGQAAVDEVNRRSGNGNGSGTGGAAQLVVCDLASLGSIRRAAADLASRFDHVDVLVNNAAVITLRREETEDGFERQLGVNHLGHFVLTGLLMPLLARSDGGRIIVVSSHAHRTGRMRYDDPQLRKRFSISGAYARSKLANVWFMKELARRLEGSKVTVNALHPGPVSTQLGVDRRTGFGTLVHRLLRPFFLTPEQGAETAVYLATSPEVSGCSGGYYYKLERTKVSARADDPEAAQRFWDWSEQTTRFHWSGRIGP